MILQGKLNKDCWYYLIDRFFSPKEKHQQLKLVCRLFYKIVSSQTRNDFERIKDQIYYLLKEGEEDKEEKYKIYYNYLCTTGFHSNQCAWIISSDTIENDKIILPTWKVLIPDIAITFFFGVCIIGRINF